MGMAASSRWGKWRCLQVAPTSQQSCSTTASPELAYAAVASIAFAALLGLIVALPGLRFAGFSLALVSFFLVLLIPNITDLLSAQDGGVIGIPGIIGPMLLGHPLSANAFYALTIACTALTLFFYRNVVRSRYGNGLLVLKHGPELARSLGLSPFRVKLATYLLAALPAGLAGVLYAYYSTYIQAGVFDFNLVTIILAASAIAGTQSIWAAPIACAILVSGLTRFRLQQVFDSCLRRPVHGLRRLVFRRAGRNRQDVDCGGSRRVCSPGAPVDGHGSRRTDQSR